jgi:hypothetical protein
MRTLPACLIAAALSVPALHAQQPGGSIDLPAGARAVLEAKAEGVQIYACTAAGDSFKWVFKAPQAKLFDASGKQIGTHFAGPTWKLTDGSQVRGEVQGEIVATKPAPEADAVAWLLLRAKAGTATGSLASVAIIRRTDTHGGAAPASGCQTAADASKTAQIPYTATYTFYAQH